MNYILDYISQDGVDSAECGALSNPCMWLIYSKMQPVLLYQRFAYVFRYHLCLCSTGGTMFWASLLINYYSEWNPNHHGMYIIHGQNMTQIQYHQQSNNTLGWNPCLPMTIATPITVTFDSENLVTWRSWYPLNICDYTNNTNQYKNEYLFEGEINLTINKCL